MGVGLEELQVCPVRHQLLLPQHARSARAELLRAGRKDSIETAGDPQVQRSGADGQRHRRDRYLTPVRGVQCFIEPVVLSLVWFRPSRIVMPGVS